jgi:hypothetical protein
MLHNGLKIKVKKGLFAIKRLESFQIKNSKEVGLRQDG